MMSQAALFFMWIIVICVIACFEGFFAAGRAYRREKKDAACPYCGTKLEIVAEPIQTMNIWICWGRCSKCGMSSGHKTGKTEAEAKEAAIKYLTGRAKRTEPTKEAE